MATRALHPLARQALVASTIPACSGWAFGLTKYLAHGNPADCVLWIFDFIRPYLSDQGEYGHVVTKAIELLDGVLADPKVADIRSLEEQVVEPWNHRHCTKGVGRLLACSGLRWESPSLRIWNQAPMWGTSQKTPLLQWTALLLFE
ncbi:MAG: hypothetical protein JW818_22240 [Pirellulales bacterium]|nr:hypothetical protein [Pirellulales bacterium]